MRVNSFIKKYNPNNTLPSYIPDDKELEEVHRVRDFLLVSVKGRLKMAGIEARVEPAGSTAKDTFIRGNYDFDIFVVTPKLQQAYDTLSKAFPGGFQKEGPMTIWHFLYEGNDVDLVIIPPDHARLDTLVHTEYVNRHLDAKKRVEVITGKAFLDSVGVLRPEVGGIPSVAVEIAVIQHGTFENVCRAWMKSETVPFLADPAKPTRNLLAAVYPMRWQQTRFYCNNFLHYLKRQRQIEFKQFTPEEYYKAHEGYTHLTFARHGDRSTDFLTALSACNRALHEVRGKHPEVKGECDAYVWDRVVVSFNVMPKRLGPTKLHCGPPAHMDNAVKVFRAKYPNTFEQDGRVCTVLSRDEVDVPTLMAQKITERLAYIKPRSRPKSLFDYPA